MNNNSFSSLRANLFTFEFLKRDVFLYFQSAESKARPTWQCVFIGMCYSIVFTSVFVRKYFSPRVTRVHKRSLAWDNVVDSHADPWNFISLEWFADYTKFRKRWKIHEFSTLHTRCLKLYTPISCLNIFRTFQTAIVVPLDRHNLIKHYL